MSFYQKYIYPGDGPVFSANSNERIFQLLLSFVFSYTGVLQFAHAVFKRLPVINSLADYIVPAIIIILAIYSLKYLSKVINKWHVLVFLACTTIIGLTLATTDFNAQRIRIYLPYMVWSIPCIFLGCGISLKRDYKLLVLLAWINSLSLIAYYIYSLQSGLSEIIAENMTGAYSLLFYLLICLLSGFKKNLISIVLSFLCIFTLLGLGNRGSIVCLMMFLFCYLCLYGLNGSKRKKISLIIFFGLFLFCFFIYLDEIFSFLEDIGFSNRIYNQLMDIKEMNGSGREEMHAKSIEQIINGPFFGEGVMGEARLYDTYAHNIVLEILLQFGILIGGTLLIIIFSLPIRAFFKRNAIAGRESTILVTLLVCYSYGQLMFSNTFWVSSWFFISLSYFMKSKQQIVLE